MPNAKKDMTVNIIENRAFTIGVFINLTMAIAGWIAYYFSKSEALLLDGNYSFIVVISTLLAIIIAKKKHSKTKIYPFGSYVFESFFVLLKGIMILGISLVASIQSIIKILNYLKGESITLINANVILYYVVVMIVLCFGLALFYRLMNKKINNTSPILAVESKSSIIDGFLSLGIGIALIILTVIPNNSPFDFLLYIGDSVIVLIISVILIKIPINIIQEAFIELTGGVMQDKQSKKYMEQIISENLIPEFSNYSNYIIKTGSYFLIVLYITAKSEMISVVKIENTKDNLLNLLRKKYYNVDIEIIIKR
jgi:predicted Co/Zn/Cd cation transporter (cation efflux family)